MDALNGSMDVGNLSTIIIPGMKIFVYAMIVLVVAMVLYKIARRIKEEYFF